MTRLPNWSMRLNDKIKEYHDKPFEWGSADCCTFGADCVVAITGHDPIETYRGKYKTELGSLKAQKRYGMIEENLDRYFPQIDVRFAQRGDICTHRADDGTLSVGVFWGGDWWVMTKEGCRKDIKINVLSVWGVGHGG